MYKKELVVKMKIHELQKLKIRYEKLLKNGDLKHAKTLFKKIKKESDNYVQ